MTKALQQCLQGIDTHQEMKWVASLPFSYLTFLWYIIRKLFFSSTFLLLSLRLLYYPGSVLWYQTGWREFLESLMMDGIFILLCSKQLETAYMVYV
jgi:hypothetical protein